MDFRQQNDIRHVWTMPCEQGARASTIGVATLLVLVIGLAFLAYGFNVGDVTDSEAMFLLGCSTSVGNSGNVTTVASVASSPITWRAMNLVFLASCGLLLWRWLSRNIGGIAGAAGFLVFAVSSAGLLASRRSPTEVVSVGFDLGLGWLAAWALAAIGGRFFPSTHKTHWTFTSPRGERMAWSFAAVLVARGLSIFAWSPDVWPLAVFDLTVGCGLAMLPALQAWSDGAMSAGWRRRFEFLLTSGAFASCLFASAFAIVRIGIDYHYMERYQALLIVGVGAAGLSAGFVRWGRLGWLSLPVLSVAVAAKLLLIHAWIPERDHYDSPRGRADAIRSLVSSDATVYTDHSFSPAFRYYLRQAVQPLAKANGVSTRDPDPVALTTVSQFNALGHDQWRIKRRVEGPRGESLLLLGRFPPAVTDRLASPPQ